MRVMRKFALIAVLQRNANFLLPLGGEGQDEGGAFNFLNSKTVAHPNPLPQKGGEGVLGF